MKKFFLDKEKKLCIAIEPCTVETPHGIVKGHKCSLGEKAFHNTIVDRTVEIGENGEIKVGMHPGSFGQDVVSLSSCPTQTYGGNVKFVFKSKNLSLRPMCYYEYAEHKEVDHGVEKEAMREVNGPVGANQIRAKYGVNISMYKDECEYVSDDHISLKENLEKIEYWIPWRIEKYSFNHGCKGALPGYANVGGYFSGVKEMQEHIQRVKRTAEKLGVPFEVKSCFTALKTGWGDQYIPLNEENFKKLAEGELPEIVRGKIPEDCKC